MGDKTPANPPGYFMTHLCYLETGCGRRGTSVAGRREETTKTKHREKREVEASERLN